MLKLVCVAAAILLVVSVLSFAPTAVVCESVGDSETERELQHTRQPLSFRAHRLAQLDVTLTHPEEEEEEEEETEEAGEKKRKNRTTGSNLLRRYGSQRAQMSLLDVVTLKEAHAIGDAEGSLFGKVVLMSYKDVSAELLVNLAEVRAAGAVLVSVPNAEQSAALSEEEVAHWRSVEESLLKVEINCPVYFAPADEIPAEVLSVRSGALSQSNRLRLSASAKQPSAISDPSFTNIEGHLFGPDGGASRDGQQFPIIMVVAHYDTFSAVPGMTSGADSNGSGAVAVLELARIFSKLYSSPKSQPNFNIVFLLTAGASLNFAGSKHWLANFVTTEETNVEFVLCVDSIAGTKSYSSSSNMYLHISKPPKETTAMKFYDTFMQQAVADNFTLVHKKVNVAKLDLAWEHEQFALNHMLAATLSRSSSPSAPLLRSHIFDNTNRVNVSSLVEAIRVIGEGIAHHVFHIADKDTHVLQGEYAPDATYIQYLMELLTSTPRVTPQYTQVKQQQPATLLKKLLGAHITDVRETQFKDSAVNTEVKRVFYSQITAEVSSFRCKPFYVDLIFTLLVLAYLVAIYVFLKGPEESLGQLKGILDFSGNKKELAGTAPTTTKGPAKKPSKVSDGKKKN